MRDPKLREKYGTAWDDVAKTIQVVKTIRTEYNLLEAGSAFNSELFGIAKTLVRMAEEDAEAQRRAAAGIWRGRAGVAGAAALFRSADL